MQQEYNLTKFWEHLLLKYRNERGEVMYNSTKLAEFKVYLKDQRKIKQTYKKIGHFIFNQSKKKKRVLDKVKFHTP